MALQGAGNNEDGRGPIAADGAQGRYRVQMTQTTHSLAPSARPRRARSAADGAVDYALMQRIAGGDETAITELYDRFSALMYRMAYQTLPKAETEDAVQEVLVRLWRTADRYDPERAGLATWVALLTRRYLVDRLRRARVRIKSVNVLEDGWTEGTEGAGGDVAIGQLEHKERYAELMQHINKLPELQQTVLKRAYLGGQTLRQIGLELDKPLGTIKSTLSRALARLRERAVSPEE